jgi:predicted rRNA methylase
MILTGRRGFVTAEIDSRDGGSETVYGVHAVLARLQSKKGRMVKLLVSAGSRSARVANACRLAEKRKVPVESVSVAHLDQITGGVHQGLVLLCKRAAVDGEEAGIGEDAGEELLEELLREGKQQKLLLVLDGVTDPHNLGACLRNSAAMGVDAVIAPRDRAVGLTPAAIKAASGATELVPFIRVTNLARCLSWLKQWGIWVIGLAAEGSQSIVETDLTGPVALVMGSENKGLRHLTRQKCDAMVYIPMDGLDSSTAANGTLDSLNVSVAAGIGLYEVIRQRGLVGEARSDGRRLNRPSR